MIRYELKFNVNHIAFSVLFGKVPYTFCTLILRAIPRFVNRRDIVRNID